jgi:hypothetical protein
MEAVAAIPARHCSEPASAGERADAVRLAAAEWTEEDEMNATVSPSPITQQVLSGSNVRI